MSIPQVGEGGEGRKCKFEGRRKGEDLEMGRGIEHRVQRTDDTDLEPFLGHYQKFLKNEQFNSLFG